MWGVVMLKLFRIELKQISDEEMWPKNCSPFITYVIAPSMDSAHIALINAYKDEIADGLIDERDINISNLTVVASEENNCFCPDFYKLVDYRGKEKEEEEE